MIKIWNGTVGSGMSLHWVDVRMWLRARKIVISTCNIDTPYCYCTDLNFSEKLIKQEVEKNKTISLNK